MVNDPVKNPQCNGEMIQYESPLECCMNSSFVPCPHPPCKTSEQPKDATFIQIRAKTSKAHVYPPKPGITIPDYTINSYVYLQTWRYDGGILACGGADNSAAWTVKFDCRIARPENNFAWQWFWPLKSPAIEMQGSVLINNVPWVFGGLETTQYFDKGNLRYKYSTVDCCYTMLKQPCFK